MPKGRQAIIWPHAHWCIYAALVGDELMCPWPSQLLIRILPCHLFGTSVMNLSYFRSLLQYLTICRMWKDCTSTTLDFTKWGIFKVFAIFNTSSLYSPMQVCSVHVMSSAVDSIKIHCIAWIESLILFLEILFNLASWHFQWWPWR